MCVECVRESEREGGRETGDISDGERERVRERHSTERESETLSLSLPPHPHHGKLGGV